jgi:hypothetical protein
MENTVQQLRGEVLATSLALKCLLIASPQAQQLLAQVAEDVATQVLYSSMEEQARQAFDDSLAHLLKLAGPR